MAQLVARSVASPAAACRARVQATSRFVLRARSRTAASATSFPARRPLSHLGKPTQSSSVGVPRGPRTQILGLSRRASYHSYDHPAPKGPFADVEDSILTAAYRRVPSHGFTAETLALGARDAGYIDISPSVLSDGLFALIRWHLFVQRNALAARARDLFSEDESPSSSSIERAEVLTWERLLGNKEIIGRWQEVIFLTTAFSDPYRTLLPSSPAPALPKALILPNPPKPDSNNTYWQALAIMAQPSYVRASLEELALLADEILFRAGDLSVDPAWYTKRASVSAIYAAAELFMTNDHSPDFCETREFLRRRFVEASGIGGAVRSLGQWVDFNAGAGINVLRSKGLPL